MDPSSNNIPDKATKAKVARSLLWIAIGSMVMLFAGLTSAYVVRHGAGNWVVFELPQMFYYSTAIILVSSVTINWALTSAKRNDQQKIKTALGITLLLGFGFGISQFMAWSALVNNGVFLVGNPAGSFVYILSGAHLAHVTGGLIYLLIIYFRSTKNVYNADNLLGIQLCSIYWHFLDVLWIYLFLFLLFIR
jgi:cytochrome c oxidase subunit III